MSRFELDTFIPDEKDHFHSRLAGVFVGRDKELATLNHFLHQAAHGSGNFIVISGEAGSGKTTLVQYFSRSAQKQGALVIEERFTPENRFAPYAPFLRIIEKLNLEGNRNADEHPPPSADIFALNKKTGNRSTEKRWDMASLYSLQAQYGLIQQRLTRALIEGMRENLLLIILSDIHLASQTSWQFIHYLSKNVLEHKILVLVTLRQDGREMDHEKIPVYADILQRMNREHLLVKIQLQRFTKGLIRKFLNTAFKRSDFSCVFIPTLYELSNGIPGMMVRCLEVMFTEEVLFEQNEVWFNRESFSRDHIARLMIEPEKIQWLVQLFTKLPNEQIKILRYAALMNGPFSCELLSKILQVSRMSLIRKLNHLKEKKIFMEIGGNQFFFKRPEILEAVKAQIPGEDIVGMHLQIARALEEINEIDVVQRTYQLAYHYFQSDDPVNAFRWLRKAFDQALADFAFTEAKGFFDQAASLFSKVGADMGKSEILYFLLKMVWLDRVLGLYQESIAHADQGLKICESNGEEETRIQILIQKGLTYFRLNDWENARHCFETCLQENRDNDPFIQAMANFGLGNICLELSQYDQARNYYQISLSVARNLDAQPLVGTLLNNLGIIENILGHRMKSITLYSQSIPIFEKLGDNFGLARIYHNIGMTYADENSWKKANEFYGKSLRASDVMGLVPLKSLTFLNRALALIHLGHLDEAREYNFKALRILERLHDLLGIAEYHKIQGILEREQRNWQAAENHLEKAIQLFHDLENPLGEAETKYEMALLVGACKDRKEALNWFEMAREAFQNLGLQEKVKLVEQKSADPDPPEWNLNQEREVVYDQR